MSKHQKPKPSFHDTEQGSQRVRLRWWNNIVRKWLVEGADGPVVDSHQDPPPAPEVRLV